MGKTYGEMSNEEISVKVAVCGMIREKNGRGCAGNECGNWRAPMFKAKFRSFIEHNCRRRKYGYSTIGIMRIQLTKCSRRIVFFRKENSKSCSTRSNTQCKETKRKIQKRGREPNTAREGPQEPRCQSTAVLTIADVLPSNKTTNNHLIFI